MSSPARVFAVLGVFSQEHPIWTTDDINEKLGYSRATGYRYVKDLVEAGFLQKVSAGRYALGARIIELDYQLRQSDPVLLAAAPVMGTLVQNSRLDAVLSSMFGGKQVVDTHRVSLSGSLQLQYGRGRPRPLFRGAAPKIIMAHLDRSQLKRIHDSHTADIAASGLGEDWKSFRTRMSEIRQQGVYVSMGELDEGIAAAAVPIMSREGEVLAALALVGTEASLTAAGTAQLKAWLETAAREIQGKLGSPAP